MTRLAVVSGGGTGMGKAITARLVAGGDHVLIIGRRGEVLEAAAQELTAAGPGQVSWCAADLTRPQDAERAAAGVDGTADVLVNNAGGVASPRHARHRAGRGGPRPGSRLSGECHLGCPPHSSSAFPPAPPEGRVVNISSIAALRGHGGGSYSAAKAALLGWTFNLAADLGPAGITANVVARVRGRHRVLRRRDDQRTPSPTHLADAGESAE